MTSLITSKILSEHKEELAQHIGEIATEILSSDGSVTFFYRRNNLALADDRDIVNLGLISEDKALRIMAVLEKSDEDMMSFLQRKEIQSQSAQSVITET